VGSYGRASTWCPRPLWRRSRIRASPLRSRGKRRMSSRWRRFEVLLPLRFNDGREVPAEWLAEAVLEVVDHFGAASYETQHVEGHWRHSGVLYRDNLVRLIVDAPDSAKNRRWMKGFKDRWRERLEELELWMVS